MGDLRLVAGLGNPGPEYSNTRHNAGFMVLDYLAQRKNCQFSRSASWGSEWTKWGQVLMVKPLTYMNRSGEALSMISRYFKIQPEETLAIVDDVALSLGRLRLRPSGSDGGHNGLKSIVDHLGPSFMRLRIGVGAAPGAEEMIDHVLGRFSKDEQPIIENAVHRAAAAIEHLAENGIESTMNLFNRAE